MNTLRQTLRTFRARPLFVLAVIAVLGLGIGATTAVFSVVNGVSSPVTNMSGTPRCAASAATIVDSFIANPFAIQRVFGSTV